MAHVGKRCDTLTAFSLGAGGFESISIKYPRKEVKFSRDPITGCSQTLSNPNCMGTQEQVDYAVAKISSKIFSTMGLVLYD